MAERINKSGYTIKKSGDVRQAGQLASGDGSTSRGATARAGTLASNTGSSGNDRQHWYGSFQEGGMGLNKFKPTTKGGKVRGGGK